MMRHFAFKLLVRFFSLIHRVFGHERGRRINNRIIKWRWKLFPASNEPVRCSTKAENYRCDGKPKFNIRFSDATGGWESVYCVRCMLAEKEAARQSGADYVIASVEPLDKRIQNLM